jgi:hypothetical protein
VPGCGKPCALRNTCRWASAAPLFLLVWCWHILSFRWDAMICQLSGEMLTLASRPPGAFMTSRPSVRQAPLQKERGHAARVALPNLI